MINAAWDPAGKVVGKPVWQLLADMSPQQIVDLVDWRYLRDALTTAVARELLEARVPGRPCYRPPSRPGYSAEILPASRAAYAFPAGSVWAS